MAFLAQIATRPRALLPPALTLQAVLGRTTRFEQDRKLEVTLRQNSNATAPSGGFVAARSAQRMSPKGRYGELSIATLKSHPPAISLRLEAAGRSCQRHRLTLQRDAAFSGQISGRHPLPATSVPNEPPRIGATPQNLVPRRWNDTGLSAIGRQIEQPFSARRLSRQGGALPVTRRELLTQLNAARPHVVKAAASMPATSPAGPKR